MFRSLLLTIDFCFWGRRFQLAFICKCKKKLLENDSFFCLLLWRLQSMPTLQTQTRLSQLKNNPPCFLLGAFWEVYVRFCLSFLKHYWHNAEMSCLLLLVKQGPRATLNRKYFFPVYYMYWCTYSEKMLLCLTKMTYLESKESSKKKTETI